MGQRSGDAKQGSDGGHCVSAVAREPDRQYVGLKGRKFICEIAKRERSTTIATTSVGLKSVPSPRAFSRT